jgi:hypothetical protein
MMQCSFSGLAQYGRVIAECRRTARRCLVGLAVVIAAAVAVWMLWKP